MLVRCARPAAFAALFIMSANKQLLAACVDYSLYYRNSWLADAAMFYY